MATRFLAVEAAFNTVVNPTPILFEYRWRAFID